MAASGSEAPHRGFKKKTIEKTIRAKMDSWIKSVDDKDLQALIKRDLIVTGGAIASMLMGYPPNDYDVYFKNKETARKVAEYYLTELYGHLTKLVSEIEVRETGDGAGVAVYIKSAGVTSEDADLSNYRYFEMLPPGEAAKYLDGSEPAEEKEEKKKKKYRALMISSNAITLSDGVQIVLRFCGSPSTIHSFYDFVHCTNYYTDIDGVMLNAKALEAILTKELRYVGSKFPICSLFRLKKFIKRGFTITAGEVLKIAYDVNQLNLRDHNVLREQLIGMDAAYFHQVLRLLEEHKWSGNDQLDRSYLFECIERVFDTNELDLPDHDGDEDDDEA